MFEFNEQSHDIVDELIILVSLCSSWHLHVDLEVCLNYDRTVQEAGLSVAVGKGEVP
jgi:hypothetical protein